MWSSCANSARCGRCSRTASISAPSNGRLTEHWPAGESSIEEVDIMAYSDKVVDHYENPRNVGSFDKNDESVGTGMVGAPACGDVMKLQIKVRSEEHTSELQSPCNLVCRLLLEKKKEKNYIAI